MAFVAGVLEVEAAEAVALGWRSREVQPGLWFFPESDTVPRCTHRGGTHPMALTFPSLRTQNPVSFHLPCVLSSSSSRASMAVRLNFSCSLDEAFCFFCALIASATPVIVGMDVMVRSPMTMMPGAVCFWRAIGVSKVNGSALLPWCKGEAAVLPV